MADRLALCLGVSFTQSRHGWTAKGSHKGRKLLLLKPSTYMNMSGKAVRYYLGLERLTAARLLVMVDDIALPFGKLRLRSKGSAGGHNGLQSISEQLQSEQYARLRFGIGSSFPRGEQSNYVLRPFSDTEELALPEILEKCEEMALSFCILGAELTMNRYH